MNRYLIVVFICICAIVKMDRAATVFKSNHRQNESTIRDTDAMLHKIDSEIGQIRQKIDSLANEEKSEESFTRKYNSCIIVAEFILSVIAMFLIWERRRARNHEHLDGIQNDAEMQDNAGNMNHDEENLLG